MPGLLSTIFDEGQSGQAQEYQVVAEGGQDVDLGLDVGLEVGGTYQNPDGSTTTWSNSQDVSLDAGVDTSFQVIASAEQASFDADA